MENLDKTKNRINFLSENMANYYRFLNILSKNSKKAPFNPEKIAKFTNISKDHIYEYFEFLKKSFSLFRMMEDKKWRANKLNWTDIQFDNSIQMIILAISNEELQSLGNFHYISQKVPINRAFIEEKKNFEDLITKFPNFFIRTGEGWITSEMGGYFAEQYLSFKKINSVPSEIRYKKIELRISN